MEGKAETRVVDSPYSELNTSIIVTLKNVKKCRAVLANITLKNS